MKFDRTIYFDAVRDTLFSGALSQQQVDGQNVILALWEHQDTGTPMTDTRWLSYMLSTCYHECATAMWPIEEYGKGQGHDYGEIDPETGVAYYGRGLVQLTWRENYHKATVALGLIDERDLEWHPEKALDILIASRIMFRGMAEGWFTGDKLGDYFNDETNDPVGARIIINNDVQKNGKLVAGYNDTFLDALKTALVEEQPVPSRRVVKIDIDTPDDVDTQVSVNGELV